ncbi:MAG TPA: hypothetical protein VGO59_13500 [Verrucomicrobiae bacterium]|jgi:hypothetical protein
MIGQKIYFRVKPLVPLYLRRAVRRRFAWRIRRKAQDVWPILPGSERQPLDWPGWPDGKKFALVLTHDVEGEGGLAQCRQLMELELKWGFRSSFNFIPESGYSVPKQLRDELAGNGFEIGVHDLRHDGALYEDRRAFAANATRINNYLKEWGAVGFRAGFMFHNLDWLHDLNILYDASTFDTDPFEPQPDGAGTIFPFWKGGINGSGYTELPYTLPQDSTLFLLFGETDISIWQRKLDWIAAHGGMALLNVHPDYLDFGAEPHHWSKYPVRFYAEFLEYVVRQHADEYWACTPKELTEWYMTVVKHAGTTSPAAPDRWHGERKL